MTHKQQERPLAARITGLAQDVVACLTEAVPDSQSSVPLLSWTYPATARAGDKKTRFCSIVHSILLPGECFKGIRSPAGEVLVCVSTYVVHAILPV